MTTSRFTLLVQAALGLCAICAVTFLCAAGRLESTSALLAIMGAGGVSTISTVTSHFADKNSEPPQSSKPGATSETSELTGTPPTATG